jgi:catechol 2,3-dioxygenase-like lactoylglutathione lyase family enzyme
MSPKGGKEMIKTVWSITFCVSDLKKAAKFYEETLGLQKKYEFSSYVGFECGNVELGLIPKSKGAKTTPAQSSSVQFLVSNVDKFYADLKKRGVKFIEELHDETWGGRQAAFADPDGNILEVTQINWGKYFSVSAEGAKKKS